MPNEEFLCIRCSRHMKTCCQTSEIYVTPGDVRRIEAAVGHRDFFERRAPADPAYADQDDDPTWRDRVIAHDGTRRVLKRADDGNCTFLGSAGCVLPLETRPLTCRIYPFLYTEAGIEEGSLDGKCPRQLLRPGQGLIDALDMRRTDAERWHSQLYTELLEEPHRLARPSDPT